MTNHNQTSFKGATLCSGIRAPEVAAPEIDWLWAADIEPFPNAVGAHHFPAVPNLGDITAPDFIDRARAFGPLNVLVAGWPCQDLSVAGKRAGLEGQRSGLFYRVMEIAQAIRPGWLLFENVPGLLSMNGGDDMRIVMDTIEQSGYVIDVDVLDAQYFGVAQRRERVFFVCQHVNDLLHQKTITSGLTIAQCLVEISHGILTEHLNRYVAGQESSRLQSNARVLVQRRMRLFGLTETSRWLKSLQCLAALWEVSASDHYNSESAEQKIQENTRMPMAVKSYGSNGSLQRIVDPSMSTAEWLRNHLGDFWKAMRSFTTSTPTRETTDLEIYTCSRIVLDIAERIALLNPCCQGYWSAASSTLTALRGFINYATQASDCLFTNVEWVQPFYDFVRSASPIEKSLGDIRIRPDSTQVFPLSESMCGYTPPSREAWEGLTYGLAPSLTSSGRGVERAGESRGQDPVGPIDIATACNAHGGSGRMDFESETFVAHSLRADGFDASEDGTGRGTPLVAVHVHENQRGEITLSDTAGSLKNGGGKPGQGYPRVGFTSKDYGADAGDIAPTLRAMGHDGSHANGGGQVAVAFNLRGREGGAQAEMSDLASIRSASGGSSRSYVGTGAFPSGPEFPQGYRIQDITGTSETISCNPAGGMRVSPILAAMAVRRLLPVECEILQGFPRGFTDVPYRGKPAADGPRYKAIGNSMAVNVMRWLLTRILEAR